jgi:predicted transcriptional regulator
MNIDETTLRDARALLLEAQARDPGISGTSEKTKDAVAYYMVTAKNGAKVSMYEVEELFGVSDSPFRNFHKRLSAIVGSGTEGFRGRERSRNAYDLYAEILSNDGATLNALIRKIHVKTSELKKHINVLRNRGLLVSRKDKNSLHFFPTDRGAEYLEAYRRLKLVVGG